MSTSELDDEEDIEHDERTALDDYAEPGTYQPEPTTEPPSKECQRDAYQYVSYVQPNVQPEKPVELGSGGEISQGEPSKRNECQHDVHRTPGRRLNGEVIQERR